MPRNDRFASRWKDPDATCNRPHPSGVPYSDPIPALKQQLAAELVRVMNGRNAADVASLMRTDPPRVIDIRKGRLERFSLEY